MQDFFANCATVLQKYGFSYLRGAGTTLLLALVGTFFGCLIGFAVGALQTIPVDKQRDPVWKRVLLKILHIFLRCYVELFRGTPMIVQAVFIYYGLLQVFGIKMGMWQAGFFIVSINTGAYMAETVRGGIVSIDPGQTEGAKAIGMNVIAFDIFHIPGIEEELGIPYVEMDELLAKSDFISVHAPAVDGGALINAERIAKMKDGVVIINTSRGTNVDEAALLDALNSGKVRAAGLDVYADEPATNVALYSHPMVSCTPHIGSATVEAQGRIGEELVEIISKM